MTPKDASVAATDGWTDPDGFRSPAGMVHAWLPRTYQTICGLPLNKAGLLRFQHIQWVDVQPGVGLDADRCTTSVAGAPPEWVRAATASRGRGSTHGPEPQPVASFPSVPLRVLRDESG